MPVSTSRCLAAVFSAALAVAVAVACLAPTSAKTTPRPTLPPPIVVSFSVIPAERAADIIRSVYPMAHLTIDKSANAIVVVAPQDVDDGIKAIASAIDVKNPTDIQVDAQQLRTITPSTAIGRLGSVFPSARFVAAPNNTVVVMARPSDMGQIKAVLGAIDSPTPTPSAKPHFPAEAVHVTQRSARDIAKAVAASVPGVKVTVSGNQILLSGAPDDVDHAKALIAQLDVPPLNAQYTQLYRLKYVDATSVAHLLAQSFNRLPIQVDTDLNAITVLAADPVQHRIADAIAQLDTPPGGAAGANGAPGGGGGGGIEVITLNAAIPGLNGAPSSTATDLATTVTQALQQEAPDLHITVPPNSTRLILTGSPYSIKLAEDLIQQLDIPSPQIVLDTQIFEVNENIAKDLGISFPEGSALLTTTFQEQTPPIPSGGTTPPPLTAIQPFYRTVPLQFTLQMGLAIQNGNAKVLADPRITTISGRTASIRAGDTISILTTTGGGTGTVATTQVQQFQTGVTLDITPVVNAGDFITITLHPTVNNETGLLNGVPQISTRDTTTTVQMADNTTLIIGGLIQRSDQLTANKIPILGDLPLIGKIFQQQQVNNSDDELVITVTPHIVRDTSDTYEPGPGLPAIPCFGSLAKCGSQPKHTPAPGALNVSSVAGAQSPSGLPTLAPNTALPPLSKATPAPALIGANSRPQPQPVSVATPAVAFTPPPTSGPAPRATQMSSTPLPNAPASPTAAPNALPTAFAQTNVYTFGAAPPNNYAAPNAPPQIFYVQAAPSVVKNGQNMTISAITSTNVTKLTFGPNAVVQTAAMNSVGPGQWQASFNFSTAGLTVASGNVQFTLTATSLSGQAVSVPIPLSVVNQ